VLCYRLHWLPVEQKIQYKLFLLVYKAECGFAPQYLVDFCQPLSVAEADYHRPRAVTSSLSGLRQIPDNVLSPCLHHWHGTGCQKRSGIFNRCNCLILVSRLTCSAALPDTGKQDTDTDIVTADISRPYNGFTMLRRIINWWIYCYYY